MTAGTGEDRDKTERETGGPAETAREILTERLERAWETGERVPVVWRCAVCPRGCLHQGDLARDGVRAVTGMELRPSGMRPDIMILGEKNRPAALMDIVDRNAPVDTRDHSPGRTRLPFDVIPVDAGESLERLRSGTVETRDSGNRDCPCPWCGRCGENRVCGGEEELCGDCLEEDARLEIPWGIPGTEENGVRPCGECGRAPDKDACVGTRFTRCSCCINRILSGTELPCHNDAYDHRHCRSCAVEIISYGRWENPHRVYCGNCAREKAEREDTRPARESVRPIRDSEPEGREDDAGADTAPRML